MAKDKKNNYFEMLEEMAECALVAARQLESILVDFNCEDINEHLTTLHTIENRGDELRHVLMGKLMKEFITPIEREDILEITNQIDDVTDTIEDVLLKIYMFDIQVILTDSIAFSHLIVSCCEKLLQIFKEFRNYRKPKQLSSLIIELNHLEEEGDKLYINAVRQLYISRVGDREAAVWTEVFNCMEKVCDTCEHTVELIEHVIMKNS